MINNKTGYFNNGKDRLEVINNNVYVNDTILQLLDKGQDGYVYRYEDKAIKLYHDNSAIKEHLNKKQIDILSSLTTKHIVLPKEKIISEEKNIGFIMEYINLDTKKDILLANKQHIIKELKEIEEELALVGQNHFLLDDMQPHNLFYNGTLYLFDPDSLIYEEKVNFNRRNLELFSWYFIRDIIFSLNNEITKKEQTSLVRKLHYLYKKGNYSTLSTFLKEIINTENLKEFRKKLLLKKINIEKI